MDVGLLSAACSYQMQILLINSFSDKGREYGFRIYAYSHGRADAEADGSQAVGIRSKVRK